MPYIVEQRREGLITGAYEPVDAGELNFVITYKLVTYWLACPRYVTICVVIGTLVCAAFEFYRRVAAPYEDHKCVENGDVYPSVGCINHCSSGFHAGPCIPDPGR